MIHGIFLELKKKDKFMIETFGLKVNFDKKESLDISIIYVKVQYRIKRSVSIFFYLQNQ